MCLLLADFLRTSLVLGAKQQIPVAEELRLVESFLSIEKIRYGKRLSVIRSVDPECDGCLVPPLLIQPLVENAIRHGIAPLVEGGAVRLDVHREGEAIEILLENPVDPLRSRSTGRRRPRTRKCQVTAGQTVSRPGPCQRVSRAKAGSRCAFGSPASRLGETPMKPLRIVIADDEDLARSLVREYLKDSLDLEIVAECRNGFEAVKAVTELKPDLLLLDIQMPRLDGFEVLDLVGRETNVIFITAYDQYAIRAFDVHAVDYLLKPFSAERLARSSGSCAEKRSTAASPRRRRPRSGRARPRHEARPYSDP